MGTRNLTKVIDSTGRTRVAQYGQWDGYPDYTGTRILDFISEYRMIDKIEKALRKAHFVSEEELQSFYSGYEVSEDGLWSMEEADRFGIIYPNLTRDTGCDILKVLVYSVGYTLALKDESEFENDDLYCEGVYTLNYQTREFISTWNGITVSFSFDALPDKEKYLSGFKEQPIMSDASATLF